MTEQTEWFRQIHGKSCNELSAEQISNDSIEFRKHWEEQHDSNNDSIII